MRPARETRTDEGPARRGTPATDHRSFFYTARIVDVAAAQAHARHCSRASRPEVAGSSFVAAERARVEADSRAWQFRSTGGARTHALFLVVPQLMTELLEVIAQRLHALVLVVGRHRARRGARARETAVGENETTHKSRTFMQTSTWSSCLLTTETISVSARRSGENPSAHVFHAELSQQTLRPVAAHARGPRLSAAASFPRALIPLTPPLTAHWKRSM